MAAREMLTCCRQLRCCSRQVRQPPSLEIFRRVGSHHALPFFHLSEGLDWRWLVKMVHDFGASGLGKDSKCCLA